MLEDIKYIETQDNSRVSIFAIIVFFIIFVPSSFNLVINLISLYVLIPIMFLYSVIKNPELILNFKSLFYLLLLFCWSLITMTISKDLDLSLNEIKKIAGVFMLCYIFVYYSSINTKYIYIFYLLYILKFFTIFYYADTHGLEVSDERFRLPELNSNMFGYFGFFSIVSAFFLWQSVRSKIIVKISLFVLFMLCLYLSVEACFYAASRAGILMSILTAALLLIIYFFYPFSKKVIVGFILIIIIGTAIVPILNSYYEGSILESRLQTESINNSERYNLAMKAFNVGCQNPVFGVGPGNYILYSGSKVFSHSSYSELFANNGIVGLFIFTSILYNYYKRNRRLLGLGKNFRKNSMYFILFFLMFLIYNVFYVFYLDLFLMGFFYVVLAHIEMSIEQKVIN